MTRSPIDPHPVSPRRARRVILRVSALALGVVAVSLAAASALLMIAIQQEYGMTTGDAIFGAGVAAIAVLLGYFGWRLWHRLG